MFEKIRLFDVYALSNRIALPGALVLLAWIATVDWITSYQHSLDPFYLILVGVVTWNSGWKWGLFFSIFSVINQTLLGMVSGQPVPNSAAYGRVQATTSRSDGSRRPICHARLNFRSADRKDVIVRLFWAVKAPLTRYPLSTPFPNPCGVRCGGAVKCGPPVPQ